MSDKNAKSRNAGGRRVNAPIPKPHPPSTKVPAKKRVDVNSEEELMKLHHRLMELVSDDCDED